jgi:hypothetical protein
MRNGERLKGKKKRRRRKEKKHGRHKEKKKTGQKPECSSNSSWNLTSGRRSTTARTSCHPVQHRENEAVRGRAMRH